MPDDSIERSLEKLFSRSTASDWKKIAMEETKGQDPIESLSWRGKDDILFLPYYDNENVAKLKFLNGFQTPASVSSTSGPKHWINLPEINTADQSRANALALEHLTLGADGVFFQVMPGESIDLHTLMKNVGWPHCFIAFSINDETFSSRLSEFIRTESDPNSLRGALFWESIPKKNNLEFCLDHCVHLKSLGLTISSASPAVEISDALMRGVETCESLYTSSDANQLLRAIAFSLAADADILQTVAKLKALRMLWMQVVRAYGVDDYKAHDLHIHARSSVVPDNYYTPHENMIKGTYSAIAAVLGGCDSLTVASVESPVSSRWARNVSSVLREESFFSSVADPVAGSYALDNMVNEIAQKAWQIFQKNMARI